MSFRKPPQCAACCCFGCRLCSQRLTCCSRQGADPTARDGEARTPLHHAVMRGHVAVVDVLLDRGGPALLLAKDILGCTPVHLAAVQNQVGARAVAGRHPCSLARSMLPKCGRACDATVRTSKLPVWWNRIKPAYEGWPAGSAAGRAWWHQAKFSNVGVLSPCGTDWHSCLQVTLIIRLVDALLKDEGGRTPLHEVARRRCMQVRQRRRLPAVPGACMRAPSVGSCSS